MKSKWYNNAKHHYKLYDIKTIKRTLYKLKQYITEYTPHRTKVVINVFVALNDDENARNLYKLFHGFSQKLHSVKWDDMQCHSDKCNVPRSNVNRLYKCESCRVARYCSKKCQIYDWTKCDHKLYCKQLTKMRKSKYLNSLRWSKMFYLLINVFQYIRYFSLLVPSFGIVESVRNSILFPFNKRLKTGASAYYVLFVEIIHFT